MSRRPGPNAQRLAVNQPLAVRILSQLGDAVARGTGTQEFAEMAVAVLAEGLELPFIELRRVAREDASEVTLARHGEAASTNVDVELAAHGERVGTLVVAAEGGALAQVRSLAPWLAVALGGLGDVERASQETLQAERRRAAAVETLVQVIQLHTSVVYRVDEGGVSPLNAAAHRVPPELPDLHAALGANGDTTVPGLVPVPGGALLFQSSPAPTRAERVRAFARARSLSRRQEATLLALTEGKANKEIAAALDVSVVTVEGHLTALFRRTGARTRTELVAAVLLGEP